LQAETKKGADEKTKLLRGVPFLTDMPNSELEKLVEVMVPKPFKTGETLFEKGAAADNFYVIEEGTLTAKNIAVGASKYEDTDIGPGGYAGERAIVTGEARAADLVAKTDGLAFTINKGTFESVLGKLDDLISRTGDLRKMSGMKIFKDSELNERTLKAMVGLIKDRKFKAGTKIWIEGKETEAALYFIRSGRLEAATKVEQPVMYELGGYIGHELLFDTLTEGNRLKSPEVPATCTLTVVEDCECGVLTLAELRSVIDTTKLGLGRKAILASSIRSEDIEYKDLKRHTLLGAGTFGQVWLVSRQNSAGGRTPYALKIQSKAELISDGQAKAVVQEKDIMTSLQHPFISRLINTYQDPDFVYMLMDICQGGELYSYLHSSRHDGVPEKDAKFYAACIADALAYMHRLGIVYRDLKPENVLIDELGYCVLVDMGFAKHIKDKTYTLCGTPLYIAPEIILNRGHNWACDHFSFGIIVYEMIDGETPFFKDGMDQMELFRAIVKGKYNFPRKGSKESAAIIDALLVKKPGERLGSLKGGENDILEHKWFQNIDYDALRSRSIKAPKVPKLKDPLDSSNFEDWSHLPDKTAKSQKKITEDQQSIFSGF
jgi:protein kinase A